MLRATPLQNIAHQRRPSGLPDQAASDPAVRMIGRVPEGRVYLYDEVRKPNGAKITGRALSGDYQTIRAASGAQSEKAGA